VSVEKSVSYLKEGHVPYEFRTTVVRNFHTEEEFERIGTWILGASKYYLQNFVDSGDLINGKIRGCAEEEMKELEEYCTTNETNVGGILGVRVTGPSGQSIFLPYSGHKFNSKSSGIGVWGKYYSSEDANINFAIKLGIGDGWPNNLSVNGQAYKYGGHSIRPVWK
jgi:hypothetical protein